MSQLLTVTTLAALHELELELMASPLDCLRCLSLQQLLEYGGFHTWGNLKWLIYNGKSF